MLYDIEFLKSVISFYSIKSTVITFVLTVKATAAVNSLPSSIVYDQNDTTITKRGDLHYKCQCKIINDHSTFLWIVIK